MRTNSLNKKGFSGIVRFLSGLLAVMILASALPARADMLISPLRVLLDEQRDSASVILRNPSDGPRTYRLEWIEQQMSEDGVYRRYKEGETMAHSPASPYLRLAPRQIVVPPNSNQSVRVHYRPAPDMKPGEYRSHLLFRVVPEVSEPNSVTTMGGGEGVTLQLNMQLSMSIPVVVRHQLDTPPSVNLTGVEPVPATEPGQSASLAVVLQREGVGSSFGRVVVDMQAAPDAPVERIGLADNISVFDDMAERRLVLPLRDSRIPAGAWLRVAYEGMDEYKGTTWAEQVFQIR